MKTTCFIIVSLLCLGVQAQDSSGIRKKRSYVFDVNAGLIVSNAISNFHHSDGQQYWQIQGKPVCFGYAGGLDFMFSKDPQAKHLIGVAYAMTNSAYAEEYNYHPTAHYPTYSRRNLEYTKQFQTIDLAYGGAFKVRPMLTFMASVVYSYIFRQVSTQTGYDVVESYGPYTSTYDSTYYSNDKLPKSNYDHYFALRCRVSYQFNIGQKTFAAFVLGNMALGYRLPYLLLGLQYYPFRKMQ